MKKYKLVSFFLFLMIVSVSYAFRLEGIDFNQRMDGKDGGYREFKIINDGIERQRYKINVLKSEDTTTKDASKFIEVFPKVVTINPKEVGIFKIFAKAPDTAEKGLYSFSLEFKPIGIPTLAKAKEGLVTGSANVNIAPLVEMYGYVGEIDFQKVLRFEEIKIENAEEGASVSGKLINDSYAVVEVGILAYRKGDYLLGGDYVGTLRGNKEMEIKATIPNVKDSQDIKKLVFYRTVNDKVEKLKVVEIEK